MTSSESKLLLRIGSSCPTFDDHQKYCDLFELVEVWKPKLISHFGTNNTLLMAVFYGLEKTENNYILSAFRILDSIKPIASDLVIIEASFNVGIEFINELIPLLSHRGIVVVDGAAVEVEKQLFKLGLLELNRFNDYCFYQKP